MVDKDGLTFEKGGYREEKKKARMNHMVLDQNPDVNELGFSFNTDTDG